MINFEHIVIGTFQIRENSRHLFDDAEFLFDSRKFQTAIPLFILSIEESLKACVFAVKMRKHQTMNSEEYGNLKNHHNKLTGFYEFTSKVLNDMTEHELKNTFNELHIEPSMNILPVVKYSNKARQTMMANLQMVKELCLYKNWNKQFSEWDMFNHMSNEKQEELAYFLMMESKSELLRLDFVVEHAVSVLRRDGFKLINLDFPPYDEIRDVKNFVTKLNGVITNDLSKYKKGENIMEILISKKAFGIIEQVSHNNIFKQISSLIPKDNLDDWYPHPMVKAIFMLCSTIHNRKKNGTYASIADNFTQTYGDVCIMHAIVVMNKNEDTFKIEKIIINQYEHNFDDPIIKNVLKIESVIEKHKGKEISSDIMRDAFAEIGLRIRYLKDDEIEPAINNVKRLIGENKIMNVSLLPIGVIPKIKLATKETWSGLDLATRSTICLLSGIQLNDHTILMAEDPRTIHKFKVRDILYQNLLMLHNLVNAS